MLVRFWGTRGSLPVALTTPDIQKKLVAALVQAAGRRLDTPDQARAFLERELDFPVSHTFGGNSSCVELETGGSEYVLCDLGSGARAFGNHVLATRGPSGHRFHVFMSHVHWDHIMGFPFFPPAYVPGNTIRIHGGHSVAVLEEAFRRQQSAPCFPVEWDHLGASIGFVHLDTERWYDIDGLRVKVKLQPHPGDSYGYRFEQNGKALVYSTDAEHKLQSETAIEGMVEFYRNADLVVFDAMYSLNEMINSKAAWGHSSNVVGVDLCLRARAKHYCMFHHEPAHSDVTIHAVLGETRRYAEIVGDGQALQVSAAYDGLVIDV